MILYYNYASLRFSGFQWCLLASFSGYLGRYGAASRRNRRSVGWYRGGGVGRDGLSRRRGERWRECVAWCGRGWNKSGGGDSRRLSDRRCCCGG